MPPGSFDKVLEQARRLPPDEQERLIRELSRPHSPANGLPPAEGEPKQSLFDALKPRGLIGCLTDAPPDLSTNPKYMEGFGQHAE